MIRGISVQLLKKTQQGLDPFGAPIYVETTETVDNVLVGQPTTDDVTQALSLYGRKVVYWLAIPKGDAHDWDDVRVILPEPFPGTYRTVGLPVAGVEANMPPLPWNKKVMVERYE